MEKECHRQISPSEKGVEHGMNFYKRCPGMMSGNALKDRQFSPDAIIQLKPLGLVISTVKLPLSDTQISTIVSS